MEKSRFLAFEFQTDCCTLKAEAVVLESVSECLASTGAAVSSFLESIRQTTMQASEPSQVWGWRAEMPGASLPTRMTWRGDKTPGSDEAQERAEYNGGGQWPR